MVIEAQSRLPMARFCGGGVTASSDGQFFPAARQGEAMNLINAKYGSEPGLKAYTHVSDQFGPFATQNIPATVSEAPYILDGLLMNEAGRKITEQYADTGGFTDHVFAVTSLLGFRFIPRIRDLPSRRLYLFDPASAPNELRSLIGGKIREGLVVQNWPAVLRSAATMVTGVMPPSQLLKKFAAYTHLATLKRMGGKPLQLAFCWAHGRRKLIKAKPQKGSPIVDEALLRIAAFYKIEDAIRGSDPDHRRAVRQDLSRPLVDEFFTWLAAQAARVSRKSDLGVAMAYMLKRQDGFRLFLDDGRVDIDSNLVENAIRSPAMNRRNALFAGHDEGGRNWARFASLIGTCKMNNVEPYAYLRDLFISIANGHPAKDIDALMPWAYTQHLIRSK